MFSLIAKPPKFALVEWSVRVRAATMRIAHTFEMLRKAKVLDVLYKGGIDPVRLCLVYRRLDPELHTYLHLRGGVGVLIRLLVSPAALRLGRWGGYYRRRGCCQYLAAGRCGLRLGTVWRCDPPWEGDQFRTKNPHHKSPLQAQEVFHLTSCHHSNSWRKLSLNSFCMRKMRAEGEGGCWRT